MLLQQSIESLVASSLSALLRTCNRGNLIGKASLWAAEQERTRLIERTRALLLNPSFLTHAVKRLVWSHFAYLAARHPFHMFGRARPVP
jgi:hypothetical protein